MRLNHLIKQHLLICGVPMPFNRKISIDLTIYYKTKNTVHMFVENDDDDISILSLKYCYSGVSRVNYIKNVVIAK